MRSSIAFTFAVPLRIRQVDWAAWSSPNRLFQLGCEAVVGAPTELLGARFETQIALERRKRILMKKIAVQALRAPNF